MMPTKLNLVLIVLKQFGTGIIISTAFVHVRYFSLVDRLVSRELT